MLPFWRNFFLEGWERGRRARTRQRAHNGQARKNGKQITCLWTPHRGAVCGIGVFKSTVIKNSFHLQAALCGLATEAVDHTRGLLGRCAMVPGISHLTMGPWVGRNGVLITIRQILRIMQVAGSIHIWSCNKKTISTVLLFYTFGPRETEH